MSGTLSKLREADEKSQVNGVNGSTKATVKPFKHFQEEAIISLSLDHPDFFGAVAQFLKPDMFSRLEVRWIIAEILNLYEKFDAIPTRTILREYLEGTLTEDDPHEDILKLVDRRSDYREVPIVKELLLTWARKKAFGMLYKPEAIAAYREGNYEYLESLFTEAGRIVDVGDNSGFWFFENLELLFQTNIIEHRTTGFPRLDRLLNNGGPSPKEVVCWMAATNVGKCLTDQTLIIEERLSRIYKLELEDGSIIQARGSREVQTTRGTIKICDLTASDELTEIPIGNDSWDLELPIM